MTRPTGEDAMSEKVTSTSLSESSVQAFTEALKGERGSLDAWLECNDEAEVRAHVEAYASRHAAPQPPAEAQAVAKLVVEKDGLVKFIRPTGLGLDLPAGEYLLHLHPSPAEAQAQGGGERVMHYRKEMVARCRDYAAGMADIGADPVDLEAALAPLLDTAPPSAPVGVEGHVKALRELRDTGDVSDWRLFESALDAAIAALAQQPAAVDGESVIIDGRRYGLDTVRTALLGLAADVVRDAALAAQPGGDHE